MRQIFTTRQFLLKSICFGLLFNFSEGYEANAQCGFLSGQGCPNTNYQNFGWNSNGIAADIEYDNFISGFHSTIVRDADGKFQIWGEKTASNGTGNQTSKVEVNATNYPNLTGLPLKSAMGTHFNGSTIGTSYFVLTTTGLHAGGNRGTLGVLDANVNPTGTAFQKLTINSGNNAFGLPTGVLPADVKMMFATSRTLAILTCSGNVYVISQIQAMRGVGASGGSNTNWSQVTINNANDPLENIIAVRGTASALIALSTTGQLYTWGTDTYLGNNTTGTTRNRATEMTLPININATASIKMIGATFAADFNAGREGGTSYYVLYDDGKLYALGCNNVRQLGNWPTGANPTGASNFPAYRNELEWVQPSYPNVGNTGAGLAMNDIKWISPNEHDGGGNASINVINNAGRLWNWGSNSGNTLGRPNYANTPSGNWPHNPGQPPVSSPLSALGNFVPTTSHILAVETGGHTTLIVNKCEENFGYIGHAINGSTSTNANVNYSNYTFSTGTAINICGAEAAPSIGIAGTPVLGPKGNICALNQTITLVPNPTGGSLSIISGPGVITGNSLSFSATTGTVVVGYTVTSDCGPQATSRSFIIEACEALPVTFISFDVLKKDQSVDLFWATAKEQNNKGFEIEHSANGKNWEHKAFLLSKAEAGISNTRLDYTFTDDRPVNGKNFYRLLQTDFDGKKSYSPIRFVQFGEQGNIHLYPNPAKDVVYIEGIVDNSIIKIYDAVGLFIMDHKTQQGVQEISVKSLNEGLYYFHIIQEDGSISIYKVVIN